MIIKDFSQFLKESNIAGMALAFVMGAASDTLIKSFVENILMAFVAPLTGETPWPEAALNLGPIHLRYGAFLADFLHFTILAGVVFIPAKKLFKMDKISK